MRGKYLLIVVTSGFMAWPSETLLQPSQSARWLKCVMHGAASASAVFPAPLSRLKSSLPSFYVGSPFKSRPKSPAYLKRVKISAGVSTGSNTASVSTSSAEDVVRGFYGGINARELDKVEELIAEVCVYEDVVFPRQAIMEFFKEFSHSISSDLQFVIDDISDEDSAAGGVTWHLEWKGRPFPFSKGCSFYRIELIDGKRQIVYGKDIVEPAVKPGKLALDAIKVPFGAS